ncbi:hypothetical protein [Streptomyces sp. NPDC001480]|uniref:hypothetical protein n=1 Tax=Streptomyces sp. NPDC001480 TaxID=3364577 RepID=UPI0036BF35A7
MKDRTCASSYIRLARTRPETMPQKVHAGSAANNPMESACGIGFGHDLLAVSEQLTGLKNKGGLRRGRRSDVPSSAPSGSGGRPRYSSIKPDAAASAARVAPPITMSPSPGSARNRSLSEPGAE